MPWRRFPEAPLSSRWVIHSAGSQCASNPPNENLLCLLQASTGKAIKSGGSEPKAVASGWGAEPMCSIARHMESIMLFTLLGLPVGLAADTEGVPVKDFDVSKVATVTVGQCFLRGLGPTRVNLQYSTMWGALYS